MIEREYYYEFKSSESTIYNNKSYFPPVFYIKYVTRCDKSLCESDSNVTDAFNINTTQQRHRSNAGNYNLVCRPQPHNIIIIVFTGRSTTAIGVRKSRSYKSYFHTG